MSPKKTPKVKIHPEPDTPTETETLELSSNNTDSLKNPKRKRTRKPRSSTIIPEQDVNSIPLTSGDNHPSDSATKNRTPKILPQMPQFIADENSSHSSSMTHMLNEVNLVKNYPEALKKKDPRKKRSHSSDRPKPGIHLPISTDIKESEDQKAKKSRKSVKEFINYIFNDEITSKPTIEGCPLGMEVLVNEEMIYLKPAFDYEASGTLSSRYDILNRSGEKILCAALKSECCSRFFIFSRKIFHVLIHDTHGRRIFEVTGPSSLFEMQLSDARVLLPNGKLLGTIKVKLFQANYELFDSNGRKALNVQGNGVKAAASNNFSIRLPSSSDKEAGKISKHWKASKKDHTNLDSETTGASWPKGLDVKLKALIIGVLFCIEFQWYDNSMRFSIWTIAVALLIIIFSLGLILTPLILWASKT